MSVNAIDLLHPSVTRKTSPVGTDVLHLKDPITGKDHWVFVQDLLTPVENNFETWDSAKAAAAGTDDPHYNQGSKVTYNLKFWESAVDDNSSTPGANSDWVEISAGSTAYDTWEPGTYDAGHRVTWNFKLWESLQDNNSAVPSEGVWWTEVSPPVAATEVSYLKHDINDITDLKAFTTDGLIVYPATNHRLLMFMDREANNKLRVYELRTYSSLTPPAENLPYLVHPNDRSDDNRKYWQLCNGDIQEFDQVENLPETGEQGILYIVKGGTLEEVLANPHFILGYAPWTLEGSGQGWASDPSVLYGQGINSTNPSLKIVRQDFQEQPAGNYKLSIDAAHYQNGRTSHVNVKLYSGGVEVLEAADFDHSDQTLEPAHEFDIVAPDVFDRIEIAVTYVSGGILQFRLGRVSLQRVVAAASNAMYVWDVSAEEYVQVGGAPLNVPQTVEATWTFEGLKISGQIETGKKVLLFIDTDGTITKIPWAEIDTALRKITKTGVDDLETSVLEDWKNSEGTSIMQILNGLKVVFGGSASFLEVQSEITDGNAGVIFREAMEIAYRLKDAGSFDYAVCKSSTTGYGRAFIVKQKQVNDSGQGFETIRRQFKETTSTSNNAHNVIASIPVPAGYGITIHIHNALAFATDGNIQSCNPFTALAKNDAGTLLGDTDTISPRRITATTGGFNVNYNDSTDEVEIRFQNESTGKTYDVVVDLSYVLYPLPV